MSPMNRVDGDKENPQNDVKRKSNNYNNVNP